MSTPPPEPGGSAPARVGLVGTGWRSEFFRRVAEECPALISIGGVLAHTEGSAARVRDVWGSAATTSLSEFLRLGYDFVVVAVPRGVAGQLAAEIVRRVPVLLETPPAADVPELQRLFRSLGADSPLQVAEQYRFQPQHAARLAVVRSGRLGDPVSAAVSAAHDYHGISLLRAILGTGFREAEITARTFPERTMASYGFDGWATEPAERTSERTLAQLVFDDGTVGLYDFADEQYFSPVRSRHVSVRGVRGELTDDTVRWLESPTEPFRLELTRRQPGSDGDLEGPHLDRITLGAEVIYRNPFAGARLTDDELAIATVLARMSEFVRGGAGFYGLADASHDAYLGHLVHRAAREGHAVRTSRQPWSGSAGLIGGRDG
ncbi:gfo/Idh/MocA family oxidoreductase [Amnibacterium sp. CER49]|uniref:Gfo/Idh/MocA family protein n=1 Tax=Amnibacterium sp. CER49 TaxID=3039161 RepID=UPI002446B442|nr:Gfo/Idh/MocA family oxidoreductase [Amnibacterium sp. CER49]MDH2442594.1 gfo/Idh/MocA family oxidoreductase [Amnibacterium sp. CER49]